MFDVSFADSDDRGSFVSVLKLISHCRNSKSVRLVADESTRKAFLIRSTITMPRRVLRVIYEIYV